MCGIVGMFQLKKDSQEQRERILELSKKLRQAQIGQESIVGTMRS